MTSSQDVSQTVVQCEAENSGISRPWNLQMRSLHSPSAHRTARKEFIMCKYVEGQFARRSGDSPATMRRSLQEAVHRRDIFALLRLYAEKMDLSQPLPNHMQVSDVCWVYMSIRDRALSLKSCGLDPVVHTAGHWNTATSLCSLPKAFIHWNNASWNVCFKVQYQGLLWVYQQGPWYLEAGISAWTKHHLNTFHWNSCWQINIVPIVGFNSRVKCV